MKTKRPKPLKRHSGIKMRNNATGEEFLLDLAVTCPLCPDGVLKFDQEPISCDRCSARFQPQEGGPGHVMVLPFQQGAQP